MKRKELLNFAVTLCLSFAMLFSACGQGGDSTATDGGEDSTPSASFSGEEFTLPRGEDEKQLTIYYNRAAGYDDCDVWMWYGEVAGRGYTFHECAYGGKVVINVPYETDSVGFIIRTGCSDPGGTSWGTANKDGTDGDRSVSLREDETVIYTKAQDAKSYTSTDGGKTLKELKYIAMADLQDKTHIKYVLSGAHTISALSEIKLVDAAGNAVKIENVSTLGKNVSNGILETETLDLSKAYTLQIDRAGRGGSRSQYLLLFRDSRRNTSTTGSWA